MTDFKFPHIQESIENFLYDEEGNIPRSKVLTIGYDDHSWNFIIG